MCGIFAAINNDSVTRHLMDGLQNLSYRGYDSAGIVVVSDKSLGRRRAKGKLENLKKTLQQDPLHGKIGIAHTRWATHGAATKRNAHPHMTAKVAVAHNGIIENYRTLREELEAEGYYFKSDTDSEVIPLLITRCLDRGDDYLQATRKTLNNLEGSYAVAVIFNDCPDMLLAARSGSPLVIGEGETGFFLASDTNALVSKASKVCYLKDGDLACIRADGITITGNNQTRVTRTMHPVQDVSEAMGKQGHPHYMLKEIHQQPSVVEQTLQQFIQLNDKQLSLSALNINLAHRQRLSIIACGTSYYAGMIGKHWFESLSSLLTDVEIASEFRYREAPIDPQNAALFISQSGETADTLAAMEHAKQAGQDCYSILNVNNSSMEQASDGVLKTLAGTEIGVASTKAFTAQLTVLLSLSISLAYSNGHINGLEQDRLLKQFQLLSQQMRHFIDHHQKPIQQLAKTLQMSKNMLFLGRGVAYPLALEGALKLKEISYIHAEAYPAGELKHGPIALIDEDMPVVIIAPPGPLFSKTLSNLREVSSRGAKVILISNQQGVTEAEEYIDGAIVMPETETMFLPILYSLPLQLLAYHTAVCKGTDIDQPRNLAKSVTVE